MIETEAIKYSLRNLSKRRGRSFLTILSIFIGITTIFIFVSYGLGLYYYVEELTTGSSANLLMIQPKGGAIAMFDSNVKLTEDDLKAIKNVPGVDEVSGSYYKTIEVESQNKKIYTLIISYDHEVPIFLKSFNIDIINGRELTGDDREALLGYNYLIPDRIFPKPISLNQKIEVNGEKIKVVGFLDEVGNPQDDSQIYVSNDYMLKLYPNETLSYNVIVATVDINNIESITEKVEKALRDERDQKKGKEDFVVQSFAELLETYSFAINAVVGFIILIALISVFVSAVNTANTMITSVIERVREIGIIKSIGARNSTVLDIFLFESAFLGFIAGIIGVVVGFLASYGGMLALDNLGYGFLKPDFNPWLFVGCIVFATVTGAISGVFPAIRASKINPVDALRYE